MDFQVQYLLSQCDQRVYLLKLLAVVTKAIIILAFYMLFQHREHDWVKTCMEYEVEDARPKKTWREIVEKDCQARKLNREDAMDRNRWMKQIRDD